MTTIVRKAMDIDAIKDFIRAQSPETKIYIGGDSERFKMDGVWYADYINVVVVHYNGKNGGKVFGGIVRERDYDQKKNKPAMRLMNEVIKTANLYLELEDALEDRYVEIHLDINPNKQYGSSCVVNEAIGYIQGTCNVIPMVKPRAWSSSYCADRYKDIMNSSGVAYGN